MSRIEREKRKNGMYVPFLKNVNIFCMQKNYFNNGKKPELTSLNGSSTRKRAGHQTTFSVR